MIVQAVVYDANGRILRNCVCQESDVILQADEPEYVMIVGSSFPGALWRVDMNTHELTARTPLSATLDKATVTADGIDEAVLSGLPIPCTVYIDGVPEVINDGSAEFSFTDPGTYIVMVNEPAYLQQFWQIEAV